MHPKQAAMLEELDDAGFFFFTVFIVLHGAFVSQANSRIATAP